MVANSSHGRYHSPRDCGRNSTPEEAREFLVNHFPPGTESRAWGGLILGGVETPKKGMFICKEFGSESRRKIRELKGVLKNSRAQVAIHSSGSNELKSFMINDNNEIQAVGDGGLKTWEQLTPDQKINFNYRKKQCLHPAAQTLVKERVGKYVDNLAEIYKESGLRHVFHISILERIYEKDPWLKNCNIFYAYANNFLKMELAKLNGTKQMKNKFGEIVTWHFVNVAEQFYGAGDPKLLFNEWERGNGAMIHRNRESMKSLVDMYMLKIFKVLSKL